MGGQALLPRPCRIEILSSAWRRALPPISALTWMGLWLCSLLTSLLNSQQPLALNKKALPRQRFLLFKQELLARWGASAEPSRVGWPRIGMSHEAPF